MTNFKAILDKINFPGYTFELGPNNEFVRVFYNEPDVATGVEETQFGRKWWLEPTDSEMGFIQTCFKALLTSLEHRARENFKYDGFPLMFPHRTLKEAIQQAKREKSNVNMPPIEFKEVYTSVLCSVCDGKGNHKEWKCGACGGSGRIGVVTRVNHEN